MYIFVATDGSLDPAQAADAVARLHEEGDSVTVFTAINIPTDFLRGLGNGGIKEASQIALEAGQGFTAGDRAAERMMKEQRPASAQTRSDSPVMHALAATAAKRTKPMAEALAERGIKAKTKWVTTENKTARSIITAVRQYDADIVVIGSHGHGRFEGMLGSTGTKLVRQCPASVLILRNQPAPAG